MKSILLSFIVLFLSSGIQARTRNYDLIKFPAGKTPPEISTRMAEKYLMTPLSRYGNTRPETPPTQITYPDVCTWPGGMWRQITYDPEAWRETSGTAMFTCAFITGVKNGWLDKKTSGTAARKGWLALTGYLNSEDELTEVCEGTNIKNDRNHYLQRKRIVGDLHGQAPLLWCAMVLLR